MHNFWIGTEPPPSMFKRKTHFWEGISETGLASNISETETLVPAVTLGHRTVTECTNKQGSAITLIHRQIEGGGGVANVDNR